VELMTTKDQLEEAFFSRVEYSDGCWDWQSIKDNRGYGSFYFNNTGNEGDWGDSNNWYLNPDYSTPAGKIPGPSDDVYISEGSVTSNSGSDVLVKSVHFFGSAENGITLMVSDGAYFNQEASNLSDIYGSTTFSGSGVNRGYVFGDVVFNVTTDDSAVMLVTTQRNESFDSPKNTSVRYQDIELQMVKDGDGWLIDGFSWQ